MNTKTPSWWPNGESMVCGICDKTIGAGEYALIGHALVPCLCGKCIPATKVAPLPDACDEGRPDCCAEHQRLY